MNSEFKRKIINHPLLYKLTIALIHIGYFFSNTLTTKGKNNEVIFKEGVMRKRVAIKVIGNNNTITIHPNCRFKKYQDHHYGGLIINWFYMKKS